MITKIITEDVAKVISNLLPSQIPSHLISKALRLNIKNVFFLTTDHSNKGVYGNCIVVLNDGYFIDLQNLPNDIEAVFRILD